MIKVSRRHPPTRPAATVNCIYCVMPVRRAEGRHLPPPPLGPERRSRVTVAGSTGWPQTGSTHVGQPPDSTCWRIANVETTPQQFGHCNQP